MILVDANVLVYAKFADLPQHRRALEWLDDQLNAAHKVGLPWESLLAFVRLTTNPRIFEAPLSIEEAWRQVEQWLKLPTVWIPLATERHAEVLKGLLLQTAATGNLVQDAHLAALAVEHGLTLYSTDGDFGRFPSLRWVNPMRRS